MRRLVIAIALVFVAVSAVAADPQNGRTQLSIFTSDLGFFSSDHNSGHTGGLGVALSHAFTKNWGVELKVADEKHFGSTVVFKDGTTPPDVTYRTFHVIPVDLLAQYRFPNSSRWTPYLAAGVHYLNAPVYDDTFVSGGAQYRRTSVNGRTTGEIGGGTSFRITPHFGLRFDASFLVAPGRYYDDMFRTSLGVGWKF